MSSSAKKRRIGVEKKVENKMEAKKEKTKAESENTEEEISVGEKK